MSAATVILVAYHGDAWVPACVASLRESLERPVRLVLVDNAGNTCIESLDLAGFDATVLRCERPLGFAKANNFALRHVDFDTEAVCFLNQDTLSAPGWLDACLDCLGKHPELGAVTPLVTTYDWQGWDQAFLECARRSEDFRRDFGERPPSPPAPLPERERGGMPSPPAPLPSRERGEYYEVPVVTAAAMVVRTEALLKAGPFDPIFGSYYEDYDLCRRIRQSGYRVAVCAHGRIAHFAGSVTTDAAAFRRRARSIARNRVIYAARWTWPRRISGLARYVLAELPRNLARSALGRSQTPLGAFLLAQGDLVRLGPRLASAACDRQAWNNYLAAIHWPGTNGHHTE
ncbi:MAG: glycosyltransferase [Thermoguttaceae bacterium]|nr:glycosyltransferase [Thermoguttaceae bacterium]